MIQNIARACVRYRIALRSRRQAWWLRCCGMQVRGACWFGGIEVPRHHDRIVLESCGLDRGVVLLVTASETGEPLITIGPGVYINRNTMIDASEAIHIGPQAMIGPNCYITDHDHGFNADRPVGDQPLHGKPTHIGRDAWLGAGVTVLKGVTVGEGAIIGAGAVVTKDIPANAIAAGVPAKVMGTR